MKITAAPLTRADVAALVGMSDSWVRDRMLAGDFHRPGQPAPIYVQDMLAFRAGAGAGPKSLDTERARLAAEQADAYAMKNAVARGEYLPKADVTATVQAAFARVRARLLAIPPRAAPVLVGVTRPTQIQAKLTEMVHEALAELAATKMVVADAGSIDA